jgi:hypothetical protein
MDKLTEKAIAEGANLITVVGVYNELKIIFDLLYASGEVEDDVAHSLRIAAFERVADILEIAEAEVERDKASNPEDGATDAPESEDKPTKSGTPDFYAKSPAYAAILREAERESEVEPTDTCYAAPQNVGEE